MKILTAKTAGFCFGVKRAVDAVYDEIEKGGRIYTYGPIIHNESVVEDLKSRGVLVLNTKEELAAVTDGTVILRSHGVKKEIFELLEEKKIPYVDTACPFVKRIHRLVEEASDNNRQVVIAGNPSHPEVEAITSYAGRDPIVIESAEELSRLNLPKNKEYFLVAQTTFNFTKFQDIVDIFEKKGYYYNVVNTICSATKERQTEAKEIAAKVDAMIVIGGSHSSNSRKLYEICSKECDLTFFIQTKDDLNLGDIPESAELVGITAGASTPNNIIEEVQNMSEQTFEQMLEESLKKTIHTGDIVEGKVIDVKEDELILNIDYKSDGILPKSEYTNDPAVNLLEAVKVGDTIEVKILKVNDGEGQVALTHKRIVADRGSKRLEDAFNNQEVLTAKVAQLLNGGLSVVVDDVRIFIPASLVSDVYEKDLSKYENQEISFVLTEYNPKKRRYIGDRKQLLLKEKEAAQKELFERIAVGDVIEGIVKNVTDFGAFVDLGGVDGLLHISEMSWGRIEHPKKLFKVGDQVKVMIKEINGTKIALTAKFDDANPWKDAASKYAVGNVVTGKVARMTEFGAFVELEPGVDALLHISQISKEHVEKPSDVLNKGDEVTAKIVDFNEESQKISLSVKALLADDEDEADKISEAEAVTEETEEA